MPKKMLIDATHAEETRVVVVDGNKVEEFDFETVNKRQLAGNIYLAKVTRVEPSLQAAFVDYGGNRHGFLAFAEIHPDYYQIPVADRKALLEEERQLARAEEEEENRRHRRRAPRPKAESARPDAVKSGPSGMDVVDLEDEAAEVPADAVAEATDVVAEPAVEPAVAAPATENGENGAPAWRAMDHASDTDDEIESIAEEDVSEEISAPKRSRSRRYKIQEVIKVRQIMLVQVVKEERGNKGAALTTYLSLAGRYCVLMPNTARGGGISRKITNAVDRKKLKEIAGEMEVPEGAGLIIRTAGAKRTKAEIKRDYEYLMRLWEEVRDLTLKSIAPATIYEEGNLIKRTIRDLYSREIDEVLVEGEGGYRTAKDFMRMIMPSHAKQVKRYDEPMPLFARYQVETYLAGMFNPVVQLKSGGYIVIGVTEALVAIDVNSGRATKEGSIEETALKTNVEAAEEIARQLRLRDLAGLIVIDFIDMEERKNNATVEKRLKDKLKTDRARIQVGRISGFGLMEMSRQRLRPGMLESTTQPCPHCHGTGLIRSDDSMALTILRALEEEGTRKRSKEVLLKAPVGIINYLFNQKREHIALIEARYGMAVRLEADPMLVSPDYSIEKFKTATRVVPEPMPVVSGHAGLMGAPVEEEDEDDLVDEAEIEEDEPEVEAEGEETEARAPAPRGGDRGGDGEGGKKKRRRRRRRRSGNREGGAEGAAEGQDDADDADEAEEGAVPEAAADTVSVEDAAAEPAPARKRTRARRKPAADTATEATAEPVAEAAPEAEAEAPARKRTRAPRKSAASAEANAEASAEAAPAETAAETPADAEAKPVAKAKPAARSRAAKPAKPAVPAEPAPVAAEAAPEAAPAPAEVEAPALQPAPTPDPAEGTALQSDPGEAAASKPRRFGWWSKK
ncbi:Rne/Rng family ribonuclease [Pseudogemmobacter blasticus]|uniref:Ribonuclease E n=1 Tax=Fuscovulum blasticum DSM 2131 TaxID=1188250 RepID=A0A2T4J5L3_FUSBL|nr:ribonuclease E/G [Fuscovulum blasticum]PTE13180.1 ribonuclease E/G [Fuscovulum blasticum DSM 2131]